MNNFIGEYQIDLELIDDILKYFYENKHLHEEGKVGVDGLKKHVKESTDLGVKSKNKEYPFNQYRDELQYCLNKYVEQYDILQETNAFNVNENYNIQHYPIGGGFKEWHYETMMPDHAKRKLVFMTYLNDLDDGGTHFKYYNYTTKAIKGKTLIWPAAFTHTHVGQISYTKEKTIVTGWMGFNE